MRKYEVKVKKLEILDLIPEDILGPEENQRRLAKDGLSFDIDNIGRETYEDEVEIIQFLRPDGRRRRMVASVGKEIAKLAENQILSAEALTTGEIALYSYLLKEGIENEFIELAKNGPGKESPSNSLIKLIKRKAAK